MISTIIAKPTKDCNADCAYCSSPPDKAGHWTFEKFKTMFDIISPQLDNEAVWIWHGGEPMLLGEKFYHECWEYLKAYNKETGKVVKFSMQSNILLYSKKWKPVFRDIFRGSVSTSFDPDQEFRTLKGSTEKYTQQFVKKIKAVTEDGFMPMVVSTFSEESAHLAHWMYDFSNNSENPFNLRINYRYPAGRAHNEGNGIIDPKTYGNVLIELWERWIKDVPAFNITPLDQMLDLSIGGDNERCPWIRTCNGRFLGIEPNGDLYNCADFADLNDESFKFGNIFNLTVTSNVNFDRKVRTKNFMTEVYQTPASRAHARRAVKLPMDCKSCRHFIECQGGCMRDAELFNRGLGGKFFYCESWTMVLDRIKSSVLSGEADNLLIALGYDPEHARSVITTRIEGLPK
nr:radical SAM protein [Vibrio splendidus]MCC4883236.1 radical SAM protein [Vibrio splendidus]